MWPSSARDRPALPPRSARRPRAPASCCSTPHRAPAARSGGTALPTELPALGARWLARLRQAAVTWIPGATVLDAGETRALLAERDGRAFAVRYRGLVIATGARSDSFHFPAGRCPVSSAWAGSRRCSRPESTSRASALCWPVRDRCCCRWRQHSPGREPGWPSWRSRRPRRRSMASRRVSSNRPRGSGRRRSTARRSCGRRIARAPGWFVSTQRARVSW